MINVLFGGNYKVKDGILLCIMSMVKHCNDPINVTVLTADVTELNPDYKPVQEEDILLFDKILKNKNPNSCTNLIQLGKEFNTWATNGENKLSQYTPFTFLRLFSDKLDLPEKIIYLDTDIMLNGNIKELFDIDISNYELGVVLDRYGKFFISPKYFNAGVLLMNMKNIKKSNLLEEVRNMCFYKKMGLPDQTALNRLCKKKLYLPRRFNEQANPKKNTIVQHFSKRIWWFPFHSRNIKQYHIDLVHEKYHIHNYDDIYEEYLKLKNNGYKF